MVPILASLAAIAAAAQALPAPGAIADWQLTAEDEESQTFLDPASIERRGAIVHFLIRSVDRVTPPDGIRSMMMRLAVDCAHYASGVEAVDAYDERGVLIASRATARSEIKFEPMGRFAGDPATYRRMCPGGTAAPAGAPRN